MEESNLSADRQNILEDLVSDKITWSEAANRLQALSAPWHNKEWKARRQRIVKEACESCGSSDGPMVVQHDWHPQSINDIIRSMAEAQGMSLSAACEDAKALFKADYDKIVPEQRPCCPKCGSVAVRWHKTDQVWKCKGTAGQTFKSKLRGGCCGHVFAQPDHVEAFSPESKKMRARLYEKAYGHARATWWPRVCERFGKEAVIESLRQGDRYASLEGTRTLCKKCAFIEDRLLIELNKMRWSEPCV